ncbi:FkbM family methyltransferase [Natrarchaeobius chitinivorans]|uniref:FkbM family methyltransferase n=1 Tax=Natrarchaeobius chitinivorans TaxID=1679083 RepID=A0A3N6M3N7_NATCH|nr:FkbM family methyltransferase [Natrarchaeobius chitinivorans]RQG95064.1 FkbM family methyltransferase [Natrarchaeobius chitinivorans]
MPLDPSAATSRVRSTVDRVARETYHRLAGENYEREWISRRNRTPAGNFRCLEPINRHGNDAMLAELDDACGPEAVVYDVGANVGIYALALSSESAGRRVVAFEPSPSVADRLRANVRLNGLEDRIDVEAFGIGERVGERSFYRSSNPELSAFDRANATRWGATVVDVRTVPVRPLDALASGLGGERRIENDFPPPDAIKIDVEGAAPEVLRGARRTLERYGPVVFVEPHGDELERDVPGEIRGVLEECGYGRRERAGYWRCSPRQ